MSVQDRAMAALIAKGCSAAIPAAMCPFRSSRGSAMISSAVHVVLHASSPSVHVVIDPSKAVLSTLGASVFQVPQRDEGPIPNEAEVSSLV